MHGKHTNHRSVLAPDTYSLRQKVRDTREERPSKLHSPSLAWCSRSYIWASSDGRTLAVTGEKADRLRWVLDRTLPIMQMTLKGSATLARLGWTYVVLGQCRNSHLQYVLSMNNEHVLHASSVTLLNTMFCLHMKVNAGLAVIDNLLRQERVFRALVTASVSKLLCRTQ